MFKRLFGGPKGGAAGGKNVTERTIDALERLTENEKNLEKRKALLEKRVDEAQAQAQAFVKQKKTNQAKLALRKKKMFEKELMGVDNLIIQLSQQKITLEQQQTTADAISSMKVATEAARDTLAETNVENVQDVLDQITEQNEENRAIHDALAYNANMAGDVEDEDLLEELNAMEQEQLDEELLQPAPIPTHAAAVAEPGLPSAPQTAATPAKPAKTQEELELEALEAEMAA